MDGLHALNREPSNPDVEHPDVDDVLEKDHVGHGRIRCPQCGWKPRRGERWQCTCGCIWNTFDTRGTCPRCSHQWRDTQCNACGQWSPREDPGSHDESA